jgi:hypothetical protein
MPNTGSLSSPPRILRCPLLRWICPISLSMLKALYQTRTARKHSFEPPFECGQRISPPSFWTSDEYGPYIYRFSADGHLLQTIQPPDAWLPRDATGHLNFTSENGPTTGRNGNQGTTFTESSTVPLGTYFHYFQGWRVSPLTTRIKFCTLQSATIQDGGDKKSTARFTRMVAYRVALPIIRPILIGEWVVPLPLNDKGNALGCSEIHYLRKGVFLALSRDGNGHGGSSNNSKYRSVFCSREFGKLNYKLDKRICFLSTMPLTLLTLNSMIIKIRSRQVVNWIQASNQLNTCRSSTTSILHKWLDSHFATVRIRLKCSSSKIDLEFSRGSC